MEIALEKNSISHYKVLPEQKTVCSMSADAVVPDTQQDILRIISTDFSSRIRSKDVDSGRVVVRGELDVNVCYVPDGEEDYSLIKLSIPFAADLGVPELDSSCEAVCSMLLLASDVNMLNPRKIAVSAGLEISAQCYKPAECEWCLAPVENNEGLFCRERREKAYFVKKICEKPFIFEESYSAQRSSRPAKLLSCTHSYAVEGTERLSGKLVVRIRSSSHFVYSDEQSRLFAESGSSVFSQLFELPELGDGAAYRLVMIPSGEYSELNEDKVSVELHGVVQLVCTDSVELGFIADAYSCSDELEVTYEELSIAAACEHIESSDSIRLKCELKEPALEIIDTRARTGRIERSETGTTVQVCADVIYLDPDSQLRSARIRGEYETANFCCCARVSEASAIASGNDIEVLATLELTCKNIDTKSIRYINSMSAEPCTKAQKRPSITLRRVSTGELWEAAKTHRSDVSLIKSLNGIESEDSTEERLILIPRIKR